METQHEIMKKIMEGKTISKMSKEFALTEEKDASEVRDYYRKATDNALNNVNICDANCGNSMPAYEIERPNLEVLGALEIVGLYDYFGKACDCPIKSRDKRTAPYHIAEFVKENGEWGYNPIFDKSEAIPDLFPNLTIEERVKILENADPYLLGLAADNLSCYHQIILSKKGKLRDFHMNAIEYFPRDILSPELRDEFANFKINNGQHRIRCWKTKEDVREVENRFPPVLFKMIKEIAAHIGTGYHTGKVNE